MDIKALFFDIDGTLVSFNSHAIAPSTVEALTIARQRNIKIFISTGRPFGFITNLKAIEHLVDGYITANGAYCFTGETVVSCHPMDNSDVAAIINDAAENDYPLVVDAERTIVVYNNKPIVHRLYVEGFGVDTLDFGKTLEDIGGERILQISPFITVEQETALASKVRNCTFGRWHPDFADITRSNIDKAYGLQEMAGHFGIETSQTMAFGDGGNDIPILRMAGIGVAMGNALDNVKQAADYITTDVDHDGISNALRHFRII